MSNIKRKICLLENSKINFQELHEQLNSIPDVKLSVFTETDNFLKGLNHHTNLVVLDVLTPGFNESLIRKTKIKTKAKVVVLTNNDSPQISYDFVDKEIKKSSSTYKELLALLPTN